MSYIALLYILPALTVHLSCNMYDFQCEAVGFFVVLLLSFLSKVAVEQSREEC